jgi:hypothetical protein
MKRSKNIMLKLLRLPIILLVLLMVPLTVAANDESRRDQQAMSVLQSMSEFLGGLETFEIKGVALEDADFGEGLIVTNPTEVHVVVKRPGSMYMRQFDGEKAKKLFINDKTLSIYDDDTGFYAKSSVPEGLDAGLDFALNELGIDLPLMDLIHSDVFGRLLKANGSVLYLRGKNRVEGVDCHHIGIRVPGADVQIWVQEGQQPLPRRMIITSLWDAGLPRFSAILNWNLEPKPKPGLFNFKAPEGARKIDFQPAD